LLCDDDDDVRSLLAGFLVSLGYTVHEAASGEEALRILDGGAEADLAIVDYAMPGISGAETVGQARLRRPDLRFLMITGHAGLPDREIGSVPLLRKPFAPTELARAAAEILAGANAAGMAESALRETGSGTL